MASRLRSSFLVWLSAIIVACPPANAVPCQLGPTAIKPKQESRFFLNRVTNFNTSGAVSLIAQPRGLARLTERLSIDIQGARSIISQYARNSISDIPRDECGVYSTVDGLSTSVEGGSLVLRASYSAALWSCRSGHVPCPIIPANPLRTCLQEWKDRLGTGAGSVWVRVSPRPAGNTVAFSSASGKDFRMDDRLRFLVATFSGFAAPLAIEAIERSVADGISITNLNDLIRRPDLPEGPFRSEVSSTRFSADIQQRCREEIVPNRGPLGITFGFRSLVICDLDQDSITLELTRSTLMKERTACFVRSQLVAEQAPGSVAVPRRRGQRVNRKAP
ncbi:hypothetical protein ABIA43_002990 [Bradyrhizobium sp. USDA 328]